jgi:hypothetical protein
VLQGSATLAVDHLLTLNDMLNVSRSQALGGGQNGERGSENNALNYSLPLGYWLLGLMLNDGRYRQSVAGAYESYLYHGKSENAALKLSRLLLRDADSKTGFSLQLWQRKASSFINDAEIEVQRRRMAGWEVGVSHETRLGEGAFSASLNYRRGTGARRAQAAPEEAFNEGSARLQLWQAEAQLVLPFRGLGQSWQFSSAWRGQYNQTPLIPLDRFPLAAAAPCAASTATTSLVPIVAGWYAMSWAGNSKGVTSIWPTTMAKSAGNRRWLQGRRLRSRARQPWPAVWLRLRRVHQQATAIPHPFSHPRQHRGLLLAYRF